jgi:hypothetical protein
MSLRHNSLTECIRDLPPAPAAASAAEDLGAAVLEALQEIEAVRTTGATAEATGGFPAGSALAGLPMAAIGGISIRLAGAPLAAIGGISIRLAGAPAAATGGISEVLAGRAADARPR